MGQVRTDHYRPALIEFAQLDFLLAARRLEENQLRTATGSVPARFLQTEHVFVKRDRLLEVLARDNACAKAV